MKIAIVDDSSLDRDFLKNGLEIIFEERNIENLEIQEFSSGEELLNYLRENPSDFFHIIFMDIYMEDLTGVETAKAIRKTDEQVKIVFITTSNEFASCGRTGGGSSGAAGGTTAGSQTEGGSRSAGDFQEITTRDHFFHNCSPSSSCDIHIPPGSGNETK